MWHLPQRLLTFLSYQAVVFRNFLAQLHAFFSSQLRGDDSTRAKRRIREVSYAKNSCGQGDALPWTNSVVPQFLDGSVRLTVQKADAGVTAGATSLQCPLPSYGH